MSSEPEPQVEDDSHAGGELYQGLLEAQMAIDSISPDAQTTGGAIYRYASSEAVIQDGRSAFHKGRLVLIRGRVKKQAANDKGEFLVVTYFRLAHASGQYLDFSIGIPAVPNRGMGNDKATGSAITYATRYAIIGMLCLPRVEKGADPEEHDDARNRQRPQGRDQTLSPPPAASNSTSSSKGSQPSRGAMDAPTMGQKINAMWRAIERLGDQPTYSDIDPLVSQNNLQALGNIGTGAFGELKSAILRVEDALKARGVEPQRPDKLKGEGFQTSRSETFVVYAQALANAADIALHQNPQTT